MASTWSSVVGTMQPRKACWSADAAAQQGGKRCVRCEGDTTPWGWGGCRVHHRGGVSGDADAVVHPSPGYSILCINVPMTEYIG